MTGNDERGVSDVVSFTLVFSTIIFIIGVVTITGIGTLGDVQEGTESNVAEQTMGKYTTTLSEHRTAGAPRRSMTIKLQGHSLGIVETNLQWSTDNGSSTPLQTNALVRRTETDENLTYESGALLRTRDNAGVTVHKPPIRCGPETAHISVVRLNGEFRFSTENRVTLRSELVNQSITTRSADDNVTLYTNDTVSPPVWNNALEDAGWEPVSTNELECTTNRVVVHKTNVSLDPVI